MINNPSSYLHPTRTAKYEICVTILNLLSQIESNFHWRWIQSHQLVNTLTQTLNDIANGRAK